MSSVALPRSTNQALGIGQFAVDFVQGRLGGEPSQAVRDRTTLFHADAVLCGLSALALRTNAPTLLRAEASTFPDTPGATVFGSPTRVKAEKAVVANCAAVREWDSNGTNFGYRPEKGATAGEFGHNDFYPVVVAACQERGLGGREALMGMILLDEIRGRLAEVFSLKTYKIDHVVHGAIGSAATYGALCGASAEQIESAIGMFVAHYIPWRAIRAGKQLSDSKGASAAISAEAAVLSMKRAMAGFLGPRDIFRNPESMFRQFVRTDGDSPFDLELSYAGDDFAVMGMHFKLGLYEHQSAGALQGAIDIVSNHPEVLDPGAIDEIVITAYEPAFGIIGDPAKRDPRTRQSADHSMVYIVSRLLKKALDARRDGTLAPDSSPSHDGMWKSLMLTPNDYSQASLLDPATREIMERIKFEHGGPEFDEKYPDGIPTRVVIRTSSGRSYDSGLVMYPAGHARNTTADLHSILEHKFELLGSLALADPRPYIERLMNLETLSPTDLAELTNVSITLREPID